MVIFKGDTSGSPSKNGMTVISNQNYNIWVPLGIPQFFSFNTATVWGHTHDDAHWYARKSRGILMISYLLWSWSMLYHSQRIIFQNSLPHYFSQNSAPLIALYWITESTIFLLKFGTKIIIIMLEPRPILEANVSTFHLRVHFYNITRDDLCRKFEAIFHYSVKGVK